VVYSGAIKGREDIARVEKREKSAAVRSTPTGPEKGPTTEGREGKGKKRPPEKIRKKKGKKDKR